jgi:hypothetical protein
MAFIRSAEADRRAALAAQVDNERLDVDGAAAPGVTPWVHGQASAPGAIVLWF